MPLERIPLPSELSHLSILDPEGRVDEKLDPHIPPDDLRALYRTMLLARAYDDRRLTLQRQGRIGTFAPVTGQEAAQLGSVYALKETDWTVPAFRELAVGLWRGLRLEDDLLYCAGREKGVNLPEDARDLPIAIPVGSQIPHATGLAAARKLQEKDEVVLCYFGDGATSEGDFHEGLNYAQVFRLPVVFLCQNNHYAISVPRARQSASETLAQKAFAYGMHGVQVDGNDLLAVYRATRDAVERARNGEGPTLIEAVTYRMGVHTTADDPTKYRDEEEVAEWTPRDPLRRLRAYLVERDLLTDKQEQAWLDEIAAQIKEAVKRFEEMPPPDPLKMFDHIWAEAPPYLVRQREQMARRHQEVQERAREHAQEASELKGDASSTGVPDTERIGDPNRRQAVQE